MVAFAVSTILTPIPAMESGLRQHTVCNQHKDSQMPLLLVGYDAQGEIQVKRGKGF